MAIKNDGKDCIVIGTCLLFPHQTSILFFRFQIYFTKLECKVTVYAILIRFQPIWTEIGDFDNILVNGVS